MINLNEVLSKCIEVETLFSDPKHWTTKVFARNNVGYEVTINSIAACSFCFSGAMSKVCNDPPGRTELYKAVHGEFLKEVKEIMPQAIYVVPFNDRATHQEVITLIRKTISRLKGEIENGNVHSYSA